MDDLNMNAADFLKEYNMDHEQIDMDDCCEIFLDEMDKGLAGEKSSLEMIPTYIETEKEVPTGKKVIVIDAGGTNFRTAIVHFNKDKKAVIEDFKLNEMPGVAKEVSRKEFFGIMVEYVSDIVEKASNIGFCFSYPVEMFPGKDGKLIHFSKEIKAKEVQGQFVGENLNEALKSLGKKPKNVIILNDTVTTLLAGKAASIGSNYESYIGFILGTGTNCAYVERNANIKKKPELDAAKSQVINIESGGFEKAPMGIIDKQFDKTTKNPSVHTFEKMISGAYLGPLILETIKQAAKDELLSEIASERVNNLKDLTTKDVSDFLVEPKTGENPLSKILTDRGDSLAYLDFAFLYDLIDRMVTRAAKLTAINLSSVVLKSGKGQNPGHPVCIVAEGTTFYKLKDFQSKVEGFLAEYLVTQKGRFYEIISVENATLIGAAIAGLTN
jgi:hexokinase